MKRTFKITVTVTSSSDEAIKELMDIRGEILSGKMQRELEYRDNRIKLDKVTATFEEIIR